MGTPKLPVVYDPRTQKFFYDLPLGTIGPITTNPSGAGGGAAGVSSIAGETGDVTLADINLDNVDNTSDADKPVSTAQQTALDTKATTSALTTGLAGKADTSALTSKADLVNGKVPTSQLPQAALGDGLTVTTGHAASFDPTDAGQLLEITSSLNAHVLVTFEDDVLTNTGWTVGDVLEIQNVGAGKLEIFPLSSVSMKTPANFGHLGMGVALDSYGKVRGRRRGQQDWIWNGDLVDNDWQSYTVTTVTGAYVFNGEGLTNQNNPTLTAKVGQEIAFDLTATGHPFWIATTQANGTHSTDFDQTNFYVKRNGSETGMVKFRGKTAGTYYYNCQYHSSGGMYGEIVVT